MEDADQYIFKLPSDLRDIGTALRNIILSASPAIEEKFAYKVPFYYYLGPLCYLNKTSDQLYIGSVKGNELEDAYNILESGNRKLVRIIRFGNISDVKKHELLFYINQSMIINEIRSKGNR